MHIFNSWWGGLDYIQDTPPEDGMGLVFIPSLASDSAAGALQLESESGSQQYMQARFKLAAENMLDMANIISANI